jgi:kinesin family protein C1
LKTQLIVYLKVIEMNLEDTFDSIATSGNLPKTPAKTPNKDFSLANISSTAKKMNYLNNSFYDNTCAQVSKQPTTSSSVPSCNVDLMQSKIEHLEKERLELSLQLHKRNEKDRNYKIKIEQLDNIIKSNEESKKKLMIEITKLSNENHVLKSEKQDLQTDVTKLTKEIRSTEHIETKDLWQKMGNLSSELKRIEKELISNNQEKNNLLKEKEKLLLENSLAQESMNIVNLELNECKKKYENLTKEKEFLEQLTEEQKQKISNFEENIHNLEKENETLLTKIQTLDEENQHLLTEKTEIVEKYDVLEKEYEMEKQKQAEIVFLPPPPPAAPVIDASILLQLDSKNSEISSLQAMLQDLKTKLFENEKKRKQLHNRLQEYKGNIRVLIRCRPFLPIDQEDPDTYGQSLLLFHEDKTSMTIIHPNSAGISNGGTQTASTNSANNSSVTTNNGRIQSYQYTFDQIFNSDSTQVDVYREVNDLIQSVLDGYRVCIFSYGQTGSGKTHTMTGDRTGANRGIIPRAFEELLEQSSLLQSNGWDITIQVSIVELYNEEFRDLLVAPNTTKATYKDKEKEKDNKEKIKISYQNNRTSVTGITNHTIHMKTTEGALKQFHELLDQSAQTRTTACTNMNETSSRSHLIVMIDFIGKHTINHNETADATTTGKNRRNSTIPQTQQQSIIIGGLKLCDLAGSERLDRTNTLNDSTRLKETVNINKSLSCLADVFNAINNKQSHVPFRNSKLTMLLQVFIFFSVVFHDLNIFLLLGLSLR